MRVPNLQIEIAEDECAIAVLTASGQWIGMENSVSGYMCSY
jgi:hypothetical protein